MFFHQTSRREAEDLIAQRIHPQTIAQGWRLARSAARAALEASAIDNSQNEEAFRDDLFRIARTTLSSKLVTYEKDYFANLAVDAVMRLRGSNNLDHIQLLKKPGGHLRDSYLEEGFLLDKKIGVGQPKRIENAKILLANTSMDTDKIKIYGSRVRVDSLNKVAEIEEAEKVRCSQSDLYYSTFNDCVILIFVMHSLNIIISKGSHEAKMRKDYCSWVQCLHQSSTHL